MKILFFNSDWPPNLGGIATYNYGRAINTLKDARVERVYVVAFKNRKPRSEKIFENVRVKTYRTSNFWLMGLLVGWQFLRHLGCGVFHATNLFPVGFWTVFWGLVLRQKTCVTFHGSDAGSTKGRPIVRKMKRWSIESANYALAVSDFTKREIANQLSIKRDDIGVFYAGVPKYLNRELDETSPEVSRLRQKYNFTDETFIILSVCRLVKRKGVDGIIEAISRIRDNNMVLLILSSGPEEDSLKQLADSLGLNRRVIFTGEVKDVSPYYTLANLVILNSYYRKEKGDFEGLGLVLLEAQSRGLPVIGTNSGGIPEAIADGCSGFVVPERDTNALAEKISLLATNTDLYAKMSVGAKSFMAEKFDPKKNISAYLEFISG